MKAYKLLALLLLTSLISACNKSGQNPTPTDALYRRWQLIEQQTVRGLWEPLANGEIIEFRPDGSVQYENRKLLCCAATNVSRRGDNLTVEAVYSGAGCETVNCAAATELKIVTLTDSTLILQASYGNLSAGASKYKPAQ